MQRKQSPLNLSNPPKPGHDGRWVDILDGFSWIQKMIVITAVSVLLSWLVMILYHAMATFFGAIGVSQTTWVVGTVTPLVVAPIVSSYFIRVAQELRTARNLAHALSITDVLTGAFNRRHFMAQAEAEFAKAQRYKIAMSVIMLDIDHFKSVNDTYGHSSGDDVLIGVSQAASKCLRKPDVLARYGGEEFIVLLPHTGGDEAMVVAERIRKEVATLMVPSGGGRAIRVTACLGVAAWQESTTSLTALLKLADDALYQGKGQGRNQTVLVG